MYDLCGMMDTFDFQYTTQIYASLAIENAIRLMNIPLCATLHQLGTFLFMLFDQTQARTLQCYVVTIDLGVASASEFFLL